MSSNTKILVLTHQQLGKVLLKTAASFVDIEDCEWYGLFEDDNIKVLRCLLKEKIAEAEDVLVLTDMLSASTTQIAELELQLPNGQPASQA